MAGHDERDGAPADSYSTTIAGHSRLPNGYFSPSDAPSPLSPSSQRDLDISSNPTQKAPSKNSSRDLRGRDNQGRPSTSQALTEEAFAISSSFFSGARSQESSPASPYTRRASDGNWRPRHADKDAEENGTSTPPTRRSVQFARSENEQPDKPASRPPSLRTKNSSLYTKLKALTASPSFISSKNQNESAQDARQADIRDMENKSPGAQNPRTFSTTLEEDENEADADAEESGIDESETSRNILAPRRKNRRTNENGIETAPSSPRSPLRPGFMSTHSMASLEKPRHNFLARRATTVESASNVREGVSEDEGRQRLNKESPWRRKSAWLSTAKGRNALHQQSPGETPTEGKRPINLRRITGIGSPTDGNDGQPIWRRHKTERGSGVGAQKWRQLASGFRFMGQGRKKERTIDHEKSAELLAELQAGSPAALMVASMFQRDEHGSKRIPVLLEQLKVSITDSELDKHKEHDNPAPGDRHMIFRIELEYGNGINRMRWVIRRSLGDFTNMHLKYKLHFSAQKYLQLRSPDSKGMPRFPKGAFPYLKGYRGLEDEGEDEEEDPANDTEGGLSGNERPGNKKRRKSSYALARRKSSTPGLQDSNTVGGALSGIAGVAGAIGSSATKRDTYPERQRKKLEVYLQKMIKFMLFRPDSNRLCKFLEVSALGMRLAAESSYHGKEGFLMIQSAKGLDFRKTLTPTNVKGRHSPKWFLVRHSYVVCVDSPEEMHVYDVFLFDSDFRIQSQRQRLRDQKPKELAKTAKESASHPQHHRLKLQNSERKLKLLARTERQLHQFEESIRQMCETSLWTQQNRFDSFAPVRDRCFAQWLVDGRDHMWVVSRALNQAKDVIYIHDWWLSPELYMRRPPAISQKWRLDRLLKRKAEQGVKVFVIVYRNIESAIPIDSEYTKFSLLDLHPNVFVQRSPNQIRQNTFFWAHHEKLCIVDHTLAFVGGIDLCFGRWDTPQHTVVDDKSTGFEVTDEPKDADHCQLWPGKDYSNPRVQDFFALNKPYEEMYDRSQVARMPWHDISMQVVGQPARDLTRHFVQRWNYILRQRKPTRPTPFLLPPPDFNAADLEALNLDGTCEVQILRSCGPWSIGTPEKTEQSIMNAYIKLIEQSEHFVYIENQFFISSCQTDTVEIQNKIGDALVERIIRAAQQGDNWRAFILIPLMPGFQNTVDSEGGTSVRLIMQYQYRSICRGESSIFGRLRSQGIEPEDYIQFYSLRSWGKIGPKQHLVSEQLYIHAKCMIVDDRVAIIGSANINERSMLGNRDSECASVVRDTDMIWSTMNGQPYQVGRFPHTLRMRLMREHLGLDVDEIMESNQLNSEKRVPSRNDSPDSDHDFNDEDADQSETVVEGSKDLSEDLLERSENMYSFNHDVDWEQADNPNLKSSKKLTEDSRVTNNPVHRADVEGHGTDKMDDLEKAGYSTGRDTALIKGQREVMLSNLAPEGKSTLKSPRKLSMNSSSIGPNEADNPPLPPKPDLQRLSTGELGLPQLSSLPPLPETDDGDIGGPHAERSFSKTSTEWHHPLVSDLKWPFVDKDCMKDPVNDTFFFDTWHSIAENNTKIYRAVFRCMPDNEVKDWKDYKEYSLYFERFQMMQGAIDPTKESGRPYSDPLSKSGPPGTGSAAGIAVRGANPLTSIGEAPFEAEKKTEELKEKLMNVLPGSKDDQNISEKERTQIWAAEANRAQFERQERRASQDDASSPQDEKAAMVRTMDTVPENASLPSLSVDPKDGQSSSIGEKATQYVGYSEALNMNVQPTVQRRRRRATTRSSRREFHASDDIPSVAESEELLNMVQGHLVVFPYDWLMKVEEGGNWLFPFDQISPLEI
ncbi:MAG: hypothetical protein Q9227_001951 [Pyrenula ochraceoflavens]